MTGMELPFDPSGMHLTPKELAKRWHCSLSHLANQRVTGEGCPYIKFQRRVLYPLREVEKFEKKLMRTSTSGEVK